MPCQNPGLLLQNVRFFFADESMSTMDLIAHESEARVDFTSTFTTLTTVKPVMEFALSMRIFLAQEIPWKVSIPNGN